VDWAIDFLTDPEIVYSNVFCYPFSEKLTGQFSIERREKQITVFNDTPLLLALQYVSQQ
jgi:hypothetical protein